MYTEVILQAFTSIYNLNPLNPLVFKKRETPSINNVDRWSQILSCENVIFNGDSGEKQALLAGQDIDLAGSFRTTPCYQIWGPKRVWYQDLSTRSRKAATGASRTAWPRAMIRKCRFYLSKAWDLTRKWDTTDTSATKMVISHISPAKNGNIANENRDLLEAVRMFV